MAAKTHNSLPIDDVPRVAQEVLRILHGWRASEDEMCRMLGISHGELIDWSHRPPNDLDKESVERIFLIVTIADHLKVLFSKNHVRWPQLINNSPMFGGETPMSILAKGPVSDIRRVKRWLDGSMAGYIE